MYMRDKQKNLTNSLQTAYKHLTLFLQEACYDSIVELESLRKITDSLQKNCCRKIAVFLIESFEYCDFFIDYFS